MRYTIIFTILSLSVSGSRAQSNGWPENPCEKVGASCDPIVPGFCDGQYDSAVELPCGPRGIVGVGCCWHAPPPN
ncbi:hypothetical protein V8C37DRAFT_377905 [Trichoderma ceciliae]